MMVSSFVVTEMAFVAVFRLTAGTGITCSTLTNHFVFKGRVQSKENFESTLVDIFLDPNKTLGMYELLAHGLVKVTCHDVSLPEFHYSRCDDKKLKRSISGFAIQFQTSASAREYL
ncbi:uncharacterized protein LOC143233433 isoform X2 [Tachypleus tridentatus]|uniref:uncharacterized protein LOC143233433 isoform X2 n=1 Tax=Tachypleus tridentatus TaxID=6853 RepID=UPI003FD429D8